MSALLNSSSPSPSQNPSSSPALSGTRIETAKLKESVARAQLYEACKDGVGDPKKAIDWNQWLSLNSARLEEDAKNLKNIYPNLATIFAGLKKPAKKMEAEKKLQKIVDFLNEKEKKLQPVREAKEELGKSVGLEKVGEMTENLRGAWNDLEGHEKALAVTATIISGVILWKCFFKKFTTTNTGRFLVGTAGGIGAFFVASELVRAATKGRKSLGVDTLKKAVNELGNGAGAVGFETDKSFLDMTSEVGIEGQFNEEIAAVADVPLAKLIELYENEKAKPHPKGGIHEINLASAGLNLNHNQKKIVSGRDLYQMLDAICKPNYESVNGYKPGGLEMIRINWVKDKKKEIRFGNFLIEIANLKMNFLGIPRDDFEQLKKIPLAELELENGEIFNLDALKTIWNQMKLDFKMGPLDYWKVLDWLKSADGQKFLNSGNNKINLEEYLNNFLNLSTIRLDKFKTISREVLVNSLADSKVEEILKKNLGDQLSSQEVTRITIWLKSGDGKRFLNSNSKNFEKYNDKLPKIKKSLSDLIGKELNGTKITETIFNEVSYDFIIQAGEIKYQFHINGKGKIYQTVPVATAKPSELLLFDGEKITIK